MGQALMAAFQSISDLDSSFLLQSYHCYFVGPVQAKMDIIYNVDRVKVGSNFCSLLVKAIQSSRVAFHCLVSFQKSGMETRDLDFCTMPMPDFPKPPNSSADTDNIGGQKHKEDIKGMHLLPLMKDFIASDIFECKNITSALQALPSKSQFM